MGRETKGNGLIQGDEGWRMRMRDGGCRWLMREDGVGVGVGEMDEGTNPNPKTDG
jgi:hypothetical protein